MIITHMWSERESLGWKLERVSGRDTLWCHINKGGHRLTPPVLSSLSLGFFFSPHRDCKGTIHGQVSGPSWLQCLPHLPWLFPGLPGLASLHRDLKATCQDGPSRRASLTSPHLEDHCQLIWNCLQFSSVQSLSVWLCDAMIRSTPGLPLRHQLGVYPNSSPLSRWCHPTISSSAIPFSSCLWSFLASGSFQMSQLFTSGGQSIGVSASASVLPVNTQDSFPLGWTGQISLQSKGLSRVFSNTTLQKHQFFGTQPSL